MGSYQGSAPFHRGACLGDLISCTWIVFVLIAWFPASGCPEWQRHRGNSEGRERSRDSRCNSRGRMPRAHRETTLAVTDEAGRFTVVNLRPGTYSMTFTLRGFSTVKREASSSWRRSPRR